MMKLIKNNLHDIKTLGVACLLSSIIACSQKPVFQQDNNLPLILADNALADNAETTSEKDIISLHWAVLVNNLTWVQVLLQDVRLQINLVNENRETALYLAVKMGYLDIVKALLGDPRIDISVTGKAEKTVLHTAVQGIHVKIVKELLNHSSAYTIREATNKKGLTPLSLAKMIQRKYPLTEPKLKDISDIIDLFTAPSAGAAVGSHPGYIPSGGFVKNSHEGLRFSALMIHQGLGNLFSSPQIDSQVSLYTTYSDTATMVLSDSQKEGAFIEQIAKRTNIKLVPQTLTGGLGGYQVPLFSTSNRNHFHTQFEKTKIHILVMHYTAGAVGSTLSTFTSDTTAGRTSAHYVITEADKKGITGGEIIQVVPEQYQAWHAGVSKWRGKEKLNEASIGIEHVNPGFTNSSTAQRTWHPFCSDQIHSSGRLSQAIIRAYSIPPTNVVGHADIAPDRKGDPGPLFPWNTLYMNYGVGAWLTEEERSPAGIEKYTPQEPLPQGVSISFLSSYLKRYGYNIEETTFLTPQFLNVLKAFKAHFSYNQHPEAYNGKPDMQDMLWIWGLTAKYKL